MSEHIAQLLQVLGIPDPNSVNGQYFNPMNAMESLGISYNEDQSPDLWAQTLSQYPALKKWQDQIQYIYQPKDGADMMESYPPDEEDRPENLKPGKFGIAVFSPNATSKDILGDIASHYLVNKDQTMQLLYQQFQQNLPPEGHEALKDLYEESKREEGENRPYEQWLKQTGMPQLLRGRLVDQFKPSDYPGAYGKNQLDALGKMKNYLGISSSGAK